MNKVILIGRLTADPIVTRTSDGKAVARYKLAVDRKSRDHAADFISCVAFDKRGEFAEVYLKKGTKIAVTGRIQTGDYTNKQGQKVYTTDVVIDEQEFCESKRAQQEETQEEPQGVQNSGFFDIPDDVEKDLPFS